MKKSLGNSGVKIFAIGLLMGACDVVPGVSGGTIAFISGIYERLLLAIKNCLHPKTWKMFFTGDVAGARKKADATFLLFLFFGIGLSIFSLASVLDTALVNSPHLVRGFFLGLIVSSIVMMMRDQKKWGTKNILFLVFGAVLAYSITQISPTQVIPTRWIILLSASIAICAMILPGISGSFLLVLMGMYGHVIGAITDKDFIFIALFGVGAVLGLGIFSRLISWGLKHYKHTILALLIGFMIGSLPKLWPWQNPTETTLDRHGEEIVLDSKMVLPEKYHSENQKNLVLLLFLLGLLGSLGIFTIFRKQEVGKYI